MSENLERMKLLHRRNEDESDLSEIIKLIIEEIERIESIPMIDNALWMGEKK
jgi:hypothetical protein